MSIHLLFIVCKYTFIGIVCGLYMLECISMYFSYGSDKFGMLHLSHTIMYINL